MAEADLKPHQSQYWLNTPDPQFDEKIKDICQVYLSAMELALQGERTISLSKMTGIQTIERRVSK